MLMGRAYSRGRVRLKDAIYGPLRVGSGTLKNNALPRKRGKAW